MFFLIILLYFVNSKFYFYGIYKLVFFFYNLYEFYKIYTYLAKLSFDFYGI